MLRSSVLTTYIFISLLAFVACTPSTESNTPKTKFSLDFRKDAGNVDSARIISEWRGLITLTDPNPEFGSAFEVFLKKQDTSLVLEISPELVTDHRQNLQLLLDSLVKHPSLLPPGAKAQLKIHEDDTELLTLLKLKTRDSFTFQPLPETAYWTYHHQEIPGYGGLKHSYVSTYLTYKLASPIPSLQYTLGFKDEGGEKNTVQDALASILQNMPPSAIDYSITTGNAPVDSGWKDLTNNYRLLVDSNQITLNWTTIDFEFQTFSPISDQDTLIKSNIAKLPAAGPAIYHVLMAPELSRVLKSYRFFN